MYRYTQSKNGTPPRYKALQTAAQGNRKPTSVPYLPGIIVQISAYSTHLATNFACLQTELNGRGGERPYEEGARTSIVERKLISKCQAN